MAALIVETGEDEILGLIKTNAVWTAALYTAPSTPPTLTDNFFTYTLSTSTTPIALNSWQTPGIAYERGQMVHNTITFTGNTETIEGYMVYDASNVLIWVERFDVPQVASSIPVNIVLNLFDASLCS